MDWLRDVGAFAQVVVVASLSLFIAALVAVTRGCTRRAAVTILVLSALPCVVGFVGLVAEMFASNRQIEALRAPTPKDLAAGVYRSTLCFGLGLVGSAVSGVLALVAFLRTTKPDEPPPIEP